LKETPLAAAHRSLGARMVEFGGWLMPVQYTGIIQEHHAVRQKAGLFDISHMGEVWVSGPRAEAWLNQLLCNDVRKLQPGQGQYSLMLFESGGVLDDLIIYRTEAEQFLLIINASMIDEDFLWMQKHATPGVTLVNESSHQAALALQGPESVAVLQQAFPESSPLPERNQIHHRTWQGISLWIARTGYTGEDGFELVFPASHAETVWNHLLQSGAVPVGLGARDTLRLEACLPLNGHELGPDITPLEAGLGVFVAWDKPIPFLGQAALAKQKADGLKRKSAPFLVTGTSAPPRAHYPIFAGTESVGEVTSGSASPTLGTGIGLALLTAEYAKPGTQLELEIRGKRVPIEIQRKPLYRRTT
jgi:aminomethyltransferase